MRSNLVITILPSQECRKSVPVSLRRFAGIKFFGWNVVYWISDNQIGSKVPGKKYLDVKLLVAQLTLHG